MKKAFLLIEALVAMIVIAFLFILLNRGFLLFHQNQTFGNQLPSLFKTQFSLLQNDIAQKSIVLEAKNLDFIEFKESKKDDLKLLKPPNEVYKSFFKDEKSF